MNSITIRSDVPLSPDQEKRLLGMVRGRGHVDHEYRYTNGDGHVCELAAVLFREVEIPGIPRGDTTIEAFDAIRFPKGSPCIYLESSSGKLTGWHEARAAIPSGWHYGIILADDRGDVWFCGVDKAVSTELTGKEALFRIDPVTLAHVRDAVGEIADALPSEGEFWMSREDLPKITAVPWWGPADATRQPGVDAETSSGMAAVLDRIRQRIANLAASPCP